MPEQITSRLFNTTKVTKVVSNAGHRNRMSWQCYKVVYISLCFMLSNCFSQTGMHPYGLHCCSLIQHALLQLYLFMQIFSLCHKIRLRRKHMHWLIHISQDKSRIIRNRPNSASFALGSKFSFKAYCIFCHQLDRPRRRIYLQVLSISCRERHIAFREGHQIMWEVVITLHRQK